MPTLMGLNDALCNFLREEIAAKIMLKTVNRSGEQSFRKPQVVRSGWALPKSIDDDYADEELFPYIMTRIDKIECPNKTRESIVYMHILYGVYDPGVYDDDGRLVDDGSGYRDFWNLVDATRLALFEAQVIDNKYRIFTDYFEAEMFGEQEFPYWEGYCKTKWHVIHPQIQLEKNFFERG